MRVTKKIKRIAASAYGRNCTDVGLANLLPQAMDWDAVENEFGIRISEVERDELKTVAELVSKVKSWLKNEVK